MAGLVQAWSNNMFFFSDPELVPSSHRWFAPPKKPHPVAILLGRKSILVDSLRFFPVIVRIPMNIHEVNAIIMGVYISIVVNDVGLLLYTQLLLYINICI